MLQSFGDKVKGSRVLGYLIVGIISVPFTLFGIQSYLGGGSEAFVAKVNDTEITVRALDQETQTQRQQLAENFGGKLPEVFDSNQLFKSQALQVLIKKAVLTQYLNDYKFIISDQDLSSQILADETFLKDGVFDQDFYKAQVNSLGYSIPQFESLVREFARNTQIQKAFLESSFILPDETARIERLSSQKRNAIVYSLNSNDYTADAPLDIDIENYFEQHKSEFKHSKKIRVAYLELNIEDVAKTVTINDEDVLALYENNKELHKSNEKRLASHILIKIKETDNDDVKQAAKDKLIALKIEIEQGASFAEIAKQESQDIGSKNQGGSLGEVEKGIMVQAFEDALFAMKEGQISEPVLTSFGYHLIYLDKINSAKTKPFSELKTKLEKELKLKQADLLFYDISEKIANQSFENSDNLEAASEASGIKIKITDWILDGTNTGIMANPKVKNAIYSQQVINDRLNSNLLELSETHIMVVRIDELQEARQKTLEEVKPEIVSALNIQNIKNLMTFDANIIAETLNNGLSVVNNKVVIEDKGYISRNNTVLDRRIVSALFKLKIENGNQTVSPVIETNKGLAVVVTDSIKKDNNVVATNPVTLNNQSRRLGLIEYDQWLNALKEKSEVEINESALE